MVKSVGERDFSAQETAHQLLSLPLVNWTFSFVALSLDGSHALKKAETLVNRSLMVHFLTTMPHVVVLLVQTWLNLCPSTQCIRVSCEGDPHQSLFAPFHDIHRTPVGSNMAGTVSTN